MSFTSITSRIGHRAIDAFCLFAILALLATLIWFAIIRPGWAG